MTYPPGGQYDGFGQQPPPGAPTPRPGPPYGPQPGPYATPGQPQPWQHRPNPLPPMPPKPPTKRPKVSAGMALALVGMAVVVLVAAVGATLLILDRRATPTGASTPAATSARPSVTPSGTRRPDAATVDGTKVEGAVFTTTMPAGWRLSERNGYGWRIMQLARDGEGLISLWSTGGSSPGTQCGAAVDEDKAASGGVVEQLPDGSWGGRPSKAMKLTTPKDEVVVYQCVAYKNQVYGLVFTASSASEAEVKAAADAVVAAWAWK